MEIKTTKKMKDQKNQQECTEKIGTKIYGRTDGNRRDEPDTTSPVVSK